MIAKTKAFFFELIQECKTVCFSIGNVSLQYACTRVEIKLVVQDIKILNKDVCLSLYMKVFWLFSLGLRTSISGKKD